MEADDQAPNRPARRSPVRRAFEAAALAVIFALAAGSAVAQGPVRISLDQAIQLALEHNHALQAARTQILQSQSDEITANLRPNPVLAWDTQFLPFFNPSNFTHDYLNNSAQFDLGIGYTFERGKKRQHRLRAAKDQTAVVRSQVADSERALTFDVAQQFIGALLAASNLDFARENLKGFQETQRISQAQFAAGQISQADLLKIQLQMLQFQTDVSAARVAKVQALASLRQLLGYESVPADYDVGGELSYEPLKLNLDDLKARALDQRADVRAARLGVTLAESQFALAKSNGKRDLGASFSYSHLGGVNTGSFFFNIDLPIFDRNQGEIAHTRYGITQSQETLREAEQGALTDVTAAYAALETNEQVVALYQSGYLDQSRKSRDISQYAYRRGAASLLDFLDAERSYRATQLAYRDALASWMLALEQLRDAVGTRKLP